MQVLAGFPQTPEAAARFLRFVNASPTPFHAVHNAVLRLEQAGFRKVCRHLLYILNRLLSSRRSGRKMIGRPLFKPGGNTTSRGEPTDR